ncbi:MAG TPA: phage integrase SAM-like domain-containing protein, partial [Bacteroidia bacterium]|nr:phage integrase SAM-like domain-containing protein [Bacteroidia bacterium]
MSKVNFYLDKTDSESKRSIFLYFSFNGKRVKLFTNESVIEKDWNPETMRVRKSYDGSVELNLILDKMQADVERIYREMLLEGAIVTAQKFKERLYIEVKQKSSIDFWPSYERYKEECKNRKGNGTLKKYTSSFNHLLNYSTRKKKRIDFDDIDSDFFVKFNDFLINEKKLTNNTIAKYIKVIKTFMGWAVEKGLTKNLAYKSYQTKENEGEIYFLSLDELMKLYRMPIDNEAQARVRDVFCF